jgi:hypothetical protein
LATVKFAISVRAVASSTLSNKSLAFIALNIVGASTLAENCKGMPPISSTILN